MAEHHDEARPDRCLTDFVFYMTPWSGEVSEDQEMCNEPDHEFQEGITEEWMQMYFHEGACVNQSTL